MSLLDALPFGRLLWLVHISLMIHNLEEAPFMENWSSGIRLSLQIGKALDRKKETDQAVS